MPAAVAMSPWGISANTSSAKYGTGKPIVSSEKKDYTSTGEESP